MEVFPPPPPLPLSTVRENVDNHLEDTNENSEKVFVLKALEQWQKMQSDIYGNILLMWKETPSILQNGPQCGIVALAMGAESFGLKISTQSILDLAISMGITKSGELFSAMALCELATQLKLRPTLLPDGFSDYRFLLNSLVSGKLLLVPYDADRNHSPCLVNGHKAHWALLTGALFHRDVDSDELKSSCFVEPLTEQFYRIKIGKPSRELVNKFCKKDIHFLAKHGKSKRIAVWSYDSLEKSNSNLVEVDPKRRNPMEYVLPPDNKLSDLCGKIVVLEK